MSMIADKCYSHFSSVLFKPHRWRCRVKKIIESPYYFVFKRGKKYSLYFISYVYMLAAIFSQNSSTIYCTKYFIFRSNGRLFGYLLRGFLKNATVNLASDSYSLVLLLSPTPFKSAKKRLHKATMGIYRHTWLPLLPCKNNMFSTRKYMLSSLK